MAPPPVLPPVAPPPSAPAAAPVPVVPTPSDWLALCLMSWPSDGDKNENKTACECVGLTWTGTTCLQSVQPTCTADASACMHSYFDRIDDEFPLCRQKIRRDCTNLVNKYCIDKMSPTVVCQILPVPPPPEHHESMSASGVAALVIFLVALVAAVAIVAAYKVFGSRRGAGDKADMWQGLAPDPSRPADHGL